MEDFVYQSTVPQRYEIRNRALIFAEHLVLSRLQLRKAQAYSISIRDWKKEVCLIEYHLLKEEAPHLLTYHLNKWDPKGVCFDCILKQL